MLTWVSREGKLEELHLTHSTQFSKLYPRLRHQEYNLTAPRHAAGVRAPSVTIHRCLSCEDDPSQCTVHYNVYSAVQCTLYSALCTVPVAQ